MFDTGRQPASGRSVGGLVGLLRSGSGRRIAVIAGLTALAAVALVGIVQPLTAAGGAQPSASDALSGGVGSVWSSGAAGGGIDVVDLITKGTIVLILLFITLRVLGKMSPTAARKSGGKLLVLESRPLAPKASLHLVAVGDRRLVVGLTPNGMVSLAELDASEFETEAAGESLAAGDGFGPVAGAAAGRAAPSAFGPTLDRLLAPLDAVTGRLAMLLGGGRTR
jgi:flagellar biogenesis protein FliO